MNKTKKNRSALRAEVLLEQHAAALFLVPLAPRQARAWSSKLMPERPRLRPRRTNVRRARLRYRGFWVGEGVLPP